MTEKYYPEPVPYTDDLPYIREFLFREFLRISASFEGVREIELEELSVEPTARAGMIKFADGVNWDPGSGKGFYGYDGTSWIMLSPGYETGVWTPSLTFGGASTGITYGVQEGRYTKIGRLVTASFRMALTSKGTATGNASIGGLPFAIPGSGGDYGSVAIGNWFSLSGLTGSFKLVTFSGTAMTPAQDTATGTSGLNDTHFTNTSQIRATAIYSV